MDSLRLDGAQPETRAAAETVAVRSLENVWLWSCLAIGSVLRVIWPLDFEWKLDEKWMFRKAESIAHGYEPWPLLGMQNGIGTENPGAAVWLFGLGVCQHYRPRFQPHPTPISAGEEGIFAGGTRPAKPG